MKPERKNSAPKIAHRIAVGWYVAVIAACLPAPPRQPVTRTPMPWEEPCDTRYRNQRFIYSAVICYFSDAAQYRRWYSDAEAGRIILTQKRNLRRQGIMPELPCSDNMVNEISGCISTLLFEVVDGHRISSDSDLDRELYCTRLNRDLVPHEVVSILTMKGLVLGAMDGSETMTGGDCPR